MKSFVVPVFPATGNRTPQPRTAAPVPRSTTSVISDTIWNATSSANHPLALERLLQHDAAGVVDDAQDAARRDGVAAVWKRRVAAVSSSGVTRPVPSAQRRHVGLVAMPSADGEPQDAAACRSAAAARRRRGCSTR